MANINDLDMSDAGELRDGFEPFPPGEYVMYLEESERKPTKANDGEYLNCTFVVKEGQFANRKVFHMFNLWNKSPDSVKGAKADWRALCEVTVNQPTAPNGDSSMIHFKPFIGTVAVDPAKDNWPAKNKMVFRKGTIKSLTEQGSAPVGAQSAPVQQQPAQQATTAPAAATTTTAARPAWAKRG